MGTNEAQQADQLVGTVVAGRYRILGMLGRGGMGVVYRAEHVDIEKPVALKVLLSSDPEGLERFKLEAKAAARIGHPNIIDITDFGTLEDGRLFFVMELLQGLSLSQVLEREAPLDPARVARLMVPICSALEAAHHKGIVHRDIKPDNIFIAQREGQETVKLLDFGIAKALSGMEGKKLTMTGQVFGTPHYLSPEQAEGQPIDHRTDVYSLGLVLYEMVTSKVAMDGESVLKILMKHMLKPPDPPAQVAPDSLAARLLNDVIMRSAEKKRDHRYQSMGEFSQAIQAALGGQGRTATMTMPVIPSSKAGLPLSIKAALIGAAVLVVALLAALLAVLRSGEDDHPQVAAVTLARDGGLSLKDSGAVPGDLSMPARDVPVAQDRAGEREEKKKRMRRAPAKEAKGKEEKVEAPPKAPEPPKRAPAFSKVKRKIRDPFER